MAVEVNHADGTIRPINTSEERQRNCMVTTKRNDSWQCLSLQRRALLLCVGSWLATEKQIVALFDLLDSVRVIVPGSCQILLPNVILSWRRTKSPGYLHSPTPWPSC